MDTFVHIYKSGASKFHCTIYRLDRSDQDNDSKTKTEKPMRQRHQRNLRRMVEDADRMTIDDNSP